MKNAKFKTATFFLITLMSIGSVNTLRAHSHDSSVKEFFNDAKESLNKGIEKMGDNFEAIQEYLEDYSWKGIIQKKATSDAVTLKHLHLNEHSVAVIVKPSEEVEGVIHCHLDKEKCAPFGLYRVVIGLKGLGAQTTIGNELGIAAGKSKESFILTAPKKPGIYEIRFRLVDSYLKDDALSAWVDDKGHEPDATTTIGLIIVKS